MVKAVITVSVAALMTFAPTQHARSQTSPAPACALTVAQSPAVRGLRLGMGVDDVVAQFPGSGETANIRSAVEAAQGAPHFGVARVSLQPPTYPRTGKFEGVGYFSMTFFDGRVTEIAVSYVGPDSGPSWERLDDWVAKLSEVFKLPEAGRWASGGSANEKALKCDGFEVRAGNSNRAGWVSLHSRESYGEARERARAHEEKKRREFKP